jgi:hypothetical protein
MRLLWRYWPWLPPSRKEILAIIFGVIIVAALLLTAIKSPSFRRNGASGFGPDWDCEQMPYGGSVCVKKLPKSAAPAN